MIAYPCRGASASAANNRLAALEEAGGAESEDPGEHPDHEHNQQSDPHGPEQARPGVAPVMGTNPVRAEPGSPSEVTSDVRHGYLQLLTTNGLE